ncbi:MAG: diguanylate cyclase, partial [Cyanobacteriota bacterium]|nr:diguanylate cyclase [Cyanobacteriota bacterium]
LYLSGYIETESIYAGTRTIVYRAIRASDGQPVIIKVLRNPHPNFNELVQFRNQYLITRHLEHPAIVRSLALERYGNGYALVMLDEGGICLYKYWQEKESSLTEFLAIAIQLSEALHYLTLERIVHKDIKPSNILIHPETRKVKLIDFSISTLLPKEQQQLANPNVLEGTLAYISPEQTGRMNRGIDYRTDFYSLGATFFELLTGQLPFSRRDSPSLSYTPQAKRQKELEFVHCHIAEAVKFPACSESGAVPVALQEIVLKLMAKNAEDRYQSAFGLKHDLEKCLEQLEATGKIASFVLGERDLCDRFNIPEKLYGREAEVQRLLHAFNRAANGATSMMLVVGFSGIGKTALINEIHKPIVKQGGYFIKGKFDQFNRNIPFFAFLQAFGNLMGRLLGESDADLANWKAQILNALGDNAQVIIDSIPELERILGKQPPVTKLSGSAAQNRFNLLFGKFVRVFSTIEHPLVIFLDDLQWADSASLNLLKLLMNEDVSVFSPATSQRQETKAGSLLVLGAYRDNEVFPTHPLMLTLDEIAKKGTNIDTLRLHPLCEADLTRLVADTLLCSTEIAAPLSKLVYQKTKGNPFFTTQFLVGLYEDGCITFHADDLYWQCDLTRVRQLALTDDVVAFMVGRLRKLPEATQSALKLAACIGNQFDLATLAVACEGSQEKVAASLWAALQQGFVVPQSQTYKFFQGEQREEKSIEKVSVSYRFLHDRVQQAAYSSISEDQKQSAHLKIGNLLLNNTSIENLEDKIFDIVNQINLGSDLIKQPYKKRQLAQLNFRAAKKAKTTTAYTAAFEYTEIARSLLPEDSWQQDYKEALSLYKLAAETAYLAGESTRTKELINILLENAKNALDRVKAYEVKIQLLMSQNKLLEAIQVALKFLSLLGIDLPKNPDKIDVERYLSEIEGKLSGKFVESLIDLPIMTDRKGLASMRILSAILNAAYLALPNLLPIIVAKQVDLSIASGHADVSPSAYANYALILCGIAQDIESGYRFGNLALNLSNKIESQEFSAKTIEIVCLSVKHWKEHINSTLEPLLNAYKIGLECGDFESASFAALDYCAHSLVSGKNLIDLEGEMFNYSLQISKLKQKMVFNLNELYRQTVLNLRAKNPNPSVLKGKAYDEEKMLLPRQKDNDISLMGAFYIDKLFLCYLFEESEKAIENGAIAEFYLEGIPGQVFVPLFYFYDALSHLNRYLTLEEMEQKEGMARILSHEARMAKWADCAPMNYAHKLNLIRGEKHRALKEKVEAMEMYDLAIAGAKENGFIQEEALANELAAKFYLHWGKAKVAAAYMEEAYYCYARWGAKAKTNQLEEKYPQLLAPILEKAEHLFNPRTRSESIDTLTTMTSVLDLTSAIEASRAISEEIELNALLCKLMRVVIENAGADKGSLILNNSGTWILAVQCDRRNCKLSSIPLNETESLPREVINTVKRTKKTLRINNVEEDKTFMGNSYFIHHQPKSLICTPIFTQGKAIGILYLENNLTIEAFTANRVEVLNLLIAQAAISIENSQLYEQVENYTQTLEAQVEARTQALVQKNQELKEEIKRRKTIEKALQEANAALQHLANLDGLTHVANRRSFDTYLQEVWQESQETQQPLALILCDVDCFKQYNDRYGHQAGDRVLQTVAKTLENVVRPYQKAQVSRYGGEEFAAILPETELEGAVAMAERIQTAIRDRAISHECSVAGEIVTLSMGVHSLIPNPEQSVEKFIESSDRALYQAKQQGRDRYCRAVLEPINH